MAKKNTVKKIEKIKKLKKTVEVLSKKNKKQAVKKTVNKKAVFKKKSTKEEKKDLKKNSVKPVKAENKNSDSITEGGLFKAKIRVVGIGGGGGSIVSEIGRSLEKASFVVADTDIRALKKKTGMKYLWMGESLTRGLGTGANPELAKQAAEEVKGKIEDTLRDQDIVILIASLGGGLGSGATEVFAKAAKEFGGITFGIFTLPFKFEGKSKQKIAQNALKILRPLLSVSLTIPNEKIFKVIDANTPITDAFSIINKSLTGSLESLIDLIYNPGVINIDFADFRTILKGRGNLAFLNTIEESGKDRADKICERVLSNPLLQNNGFLAEKILFNVAGSDSLPMFEVEKISRHIADANPKAKIIFGISKNPKLKSKIKTTILMTGGGEAEKAVKEEIKQEKVELEVKETKPAKKIETPRVVKIIKKKEKKKKNKKPQNKKEKTKVEEKEPKTQPETLAPVFSGTPFPANVATINDRKLSIIEAQADAKKGIRRSGLEIKRAQEQEELKRTQQEKEWEIPAFLRRVKFKS